MSSTGQEKKNFAKALNTIILIKHFIFALK